MYNKDYGLHIVCLSLRINMNKFRQWYLENATEITWFLVGWLSLAGLEALGREQYTTALIDFVLAYGNYYMNKRT